MHHQPGSTNVSVYSKAGVHFWYDAMNFLQASLMADDNYIHWLKYRKQLPENSEE